jgi:hypothetical protein
MFQNPKHRKNNVKIQTFILKKISNFFILSFMASSQIWLGPLLDGY